jgi:hypothetical protein
MTANCDYGGNRRAKKTVEAKFVDVVCDDQDAFATEERWELLLKCFPSWGEFYNFLDVKFEEKSL